MTGKGVHLIAAAFVAAGALLPFGLGAQEITDPRTLIAPSVLRAIADEVSGALALAHVAEMVPYERDRPVQEYGNGTYREAAYIAAKAREYGFDEVAIERFPQPQPEWDGESAELWVEQPVRRLVTRYRDLTATLAPGSRTADVTAELIYVGRGDRVADYGGKDVRGKIVLASAAVGPVHNVAVRKFGAAGVASFFNGSGMPIERPDQIGWSSLTPVPADAEAQGLARTTTFGFVLSHRMGMDLVDLLERGEPVVVRAVTKASEHPAEHQVVVATIRGDGSIGPAEKPELVYSAHLFEGIAKQSANDNAGGPAVELELGRAWIALVKLGVLPRPKRTVRFLWIPEFSGTHAYVARHPEFMPRVLAAINMDMVGASQSASMNSLHLSTSPYSLPNYLNDVAALFMDYVGETNRDQKTYTRRPRFGLHNPIVDPQGSRDPFLYHVDKFFGGSDHVVFIEATPRVAAVGFNTYHDFFYHTSEDSTRFMDATQMKRAAFIGLAMGHVLANATAGDALSIASVTAAYGQRRVAADLLAATTMITAALTADALHVAYKEALNIVRWAHWREKGNIRAAATLMGREHPALAHLTALESAAAAGEPVDARTIQAVYLARSAALNVTPTLEPKPTASEQRASRLVPRPAPGRPDAMPRTGLGGRPSILGSAYDMEARFFADGTRSILDVRNAISAEFGAIGVDEVVAFFRALEKEGSWTIEERPDPGRRTVDARGRRD